MSYYSKVIYPNGGAGSYSVTFPYLDQTHVSVLDNNGVYSGTVVWTSPSTITLTPDIIGSHTVEIRRVTPRDVSLVTFQAGPLASHDLNTAHLQDLYITQEIIDADLSGGGFSSPTTWPDVTAKPAAINALAALTPAADKLAYFTGPATAALADLTSAARQVMAAVSLSAIFALIQPLSARGDILTHTGSNIGVLSVGTNGQVLTADSAQPGGIKWATPSVGGGGDMFKSDNLSGLTNYATARANMGLTIGTHVQAYDADLTALAGVSSNVDKLPYFNGVASATVTTLTSFGRSLIDDADAATGRGTLGLGTIATQAASNVAITGGTLTGITGLAGTLPNVMSISFVDGTQGYTDSDGYGHEHGDVDYFRLWRTLPTGSIPLNGAGHVWNTTRFTGFIGSKLQDSDTSGDQKGALYLLNLAHGGGGTTLTGTGSMALLAQTFVENSAYGSGAWGAVIDVYCQNNAFITESSTKALELGAYLYNSSLECSDLNDYVRFKGALWLNCMGTGAKRQTYGIAFGGASGGAGWFYGIHVRAVFNEFLRLEDPMQANTVGIRFMNSSNWGDSLQLPSASALTKWDGTSAYERLISWTTSAVTLGASGDTLTVASSSSTFTNGVSLSSTLGVSGATTLASMSATTGTFSSTLGVSGLASLNASATITGVLTVTSPSTQAISLASPPASTIGVKFDTSGNWSEALRLPTVSKFTKHDGIGGTQDVFAWDGTNITIGNSTNNVRLDLTSQGLGVKTVKVGGTDSGGSGFRLLRVDN